MQKIELQNLPPATFNRKMRELYQDLIDITTEENNKGCLKSIPINYGYIFFWYGYLNKKNLQKHAAAYVPKEKLREIKKTKKQKAETPLQAQISDYLFQITRDHPEVIEAGHAEVHLAMLTPKLKQMNITQAHQALSTYAKKLEKLEKFTRKYLKKKAGRIVEEIETKFEAIDFVTQTEVEKWADEYFWEDECGYIELAHKRLACEIQVRVHFNSDDTLQQVVDRIDTAVNPIKRELDPMFRFGKSLWPF
jgi:hypothetical protein